MVVKIVDDPALKGEGKLPERRKAVRKVANDIFDFAEIAKRALARHWLPLSDKQRTEFVGLFADLLERSYISKIELYGGEKIQYTSERLDGDIASVISRTLVLFVRAIVLLVDHDQTKRLHGGKDRRARADDDVDITTPDAMPLIVPLAV